MPEKIVEKKELKMFGNWNHEFLYLHPLSERRMNGEGRGGRVH